MLKGLAVSLWSLWVMVATVIAAMYLLSKRKEVAEFLASPEKPLVGRVIATLVFSLLIMAASKFTLLVAEARINVRDAIAFLAAFIIGPVEGLIVGLIGGLYRIHLGGWTAVACGLATISAGIIAWYLAKYKNFNVIKMNKRQIYLAVLAIVLWETIHTQIYCPVFEAIQEKSPGFAETVSKVFAAETPIAPKKINGSYIGFVGAFILLLKKIWIPMVVANAILVAGGILLVRDIVVRRVAEILAETDLETLTKAIETVKAEKK